LGQRDSRCELFSLCHLHPRDRARRASGCAPGRGARRSSPRLVDDQILPRFEDRILAVDTAVAQRCAHLHVPDPRAERDALIAATALVHGLTVVTRNVTDFGTAGVALLNPWDAEAAGKPR
jgi:predicted nucleic acid-binding protein